MAENNRFLRDDDSQTHKIEKAYRSNKYIVTFKSVYQPYYSVNVGYYAQKVYQSDTTALTIPGRFFHLTGDEVNRLIGRKIFLNL